MIDQNRIDTIPFHPEDMLRILGNNPQNAADARLNQISGPARSFFLDGKLVGCGGVRIKGVGEAWACYKPEAFEHIWDVFNQSKALMEQVIRDKQLWRLWAEMTVSDDRHKIFLKRMGFNSTEAFVR